MHFVFQESRTWEASDPVRKPVRIRAKTEERARKKLPKLGSGRKWILIDVERKL